MAVRSVFLPRPQIRRDTIAITGDEHTHLRVSRAGVGEPVEVFDGAGHVWEGRISASDRDSTSVRISAERFEPAPSVELVLAQAFIKSRAFDWALEKAVEIGVTRVVPFRAQRSNARGDGRDTRWSRIVVEAAKQSKRYYLPRVDPLVSFEQALAIPARSKILFALGSGGSLESAISAPPVLYMIGPEGGWVAEEIEAAHRLGFQIIGLGSHIMRAETAAVVAGGLIAHALEII